MLFAAFCDTLLRGEGLLRHSPGEMELQKTPNCALCSLPQPPWEHRHLAGCRGYRPAGEQGDIPGPTSQRRLPPGRRRSRPRAFATSSEEERAQIVAYPTHCDRLYLNLNLNPPEGAAIDTAVFIISMTNGSEYRAEKGLIVKSIFCSPRMSLISTRAVILSEKVSFPLKTSRSISPPFRASSAREPYR